MEMIGGICNHVRRWSSGTEIHPPFFIPCAYELLYMEVPPHSACHPWLGRGFIRQYSRSSFLVILFLLVATETHGERQIWVLDQAI